MTADRNALPSGLLDDVKNHLNITWDDDATDKKLSGIIASGMSYIDIKAGVDMDYTIDGLARTLLLEYARYMRDDALDVFENNYRMMLLSLQNERRVEAYVQSAKQNEA